MIHGYKLHDKIHAATIYIYKEENIPAAVFENTFNFTLF